MEPLYWCIALIVALVATTPSRATVNPHGPLHIQSLTGGWGGEGWYIVADQPIGECSAQVYFLLSGVGMFKEYTALLYMAYQTNSPIIITMDGCTSSGAGNAIALAISH